MTRRREQILNILKDVGQGFQTDFELGREDRRAAFLRGRDLGGETGEATRMQLMMGTHPGVFRMQEALGTIKPEQKAALKELDMDLRGSSAHKVGQFLGSAANDLVQDATRSVYWLLNAPQATAEVINESILAKAVPELYRKSPVQSTDVPYTAILDKSGKRVGKKDRILNIQNSEDKEEMLRRKYAKKILKGGEEKFVPSRSYSFSDSGDLQKRNYEPGMIQSLAIPTGIAINSGLGLLTPFGGAEGYKAAIPSEEDPSKTENILLEVASKYILGRTGQLLPYSEFSQVRPDVSRDEYNQYQAFKYDKAEDYNPLDGDFSVLSGVVKGTSEGIHGPELQMLGRSLPVTTGLIPFATSLAGGVAGARYGRKSGKAAIAGLGGGMAGVLSGHVVGNIIEQERRRRNSVENQLEGGNAEGYLR